MPGLHLESGLALKKFIDVGAGVVDSDYIEVSLGLYYTTTLKKTLRSKKETESQLILERIKTPVVQKVQALDQTDIGAGGFGNGMQSQGQSELVKRVKQRKRKLNLLNSEHNSGRYQAQWNQQWSLRRGQSTRSDPKNCRWGCYRIFQPCFWGSDHWRSGVRMGIGLYK